METIFTIAMSSYDIQRTRSYFKSEHQYHSTRQWYFFKKTALTWPPPPWNNSALSPEGGEGIEEWSSGSRGRGRQDGWCVALAIQEYFHSEERLQEITKPPNSKTPSFLKVLQHLRPSLFLSSATFSSLGSCDQVSLAPLPVTPSP